MKSLLQATFLLCITSILIGCSAGDLRAFGDAMGNTYYPDQEDKTYVGDIKWVNGVKKNAAYYKLYNTGDEYCRARITFENGDKRTFRLKPHASTIKHSMSKYNQGTYLDTICGRTSGVFNASFDD